MAQKMPMLIGTDVKCIELIGGGTKDADGHW